MMMKDPRGRIQPRDKLEELPEERSEELALKEARKKSWLVHLNKEAILIADSNDLFEESPPETMGSPLSLCPFFISGLVQGLSRSSFPL